MAAKTTLTLTGTGYTDAIELKDQTILRIQCGAGWDTADLYAEERLSDDGSWGPLYDDEGNRITIAIAASRTVRLDERIFQHARAVRFQSSNSQGATRTLTIQTERITALIHGVAA